LSFVASQFFIGDHGIPVFQCRPPGWPDWANFRLLDNCLIWMSIFQLHKWPKFYKYFFPKKLCINLDHKWARLCHICPLHPYICNCRMYVRSGNLFGNKQK
jgi:hypothetical protein